MKIRYLLGWYVAVAACLYLPSAAAQFNQDYTEVTIPCYNCGNPNTDWRRYRNVAVMACTYGAESGQVDHACEDAIETNIMLTRDAWVHVRVCTEITDINETFGCQRVSLRARFDPLLQVDLPFIDFEDGTLISTTKDILASQTLPSGDTFETPYLPELEIVFTSNPHTPYAEDHPYHEDNGGEPAPPTDGTDTGGSSSSGSGGNGGNTGNGGNGGGNCSNGNFNHQVP